MWGTAYTYQGYLPRITKEELYSKKEELEDAIDLAWREILSYMASTPPAVKDDGEGEEYPYPEFLAMKVKELREEVSNSERLLERIDNCLETMKEHPENVQED